MFTFILLALGALAVYQFLATMWQFKKNIDAAKASGLPYIIVPVFVWGVLWLILNRPVVKLLHKIPEKHRPIWMDRVSSMHSWDNLMSNYVGTGTGTDTYLTVSPMSLVLWTANAEVIIQATTRRNDFPKPGKMYRAINIYGKNLVTAEGQLWRRHRKITGPPFTEKNNHMVFRESIRQAEFMAKSWMDSDATQSPTIKSVAHDCMRLTLHVISRAGFGVKLQWPGIESTKESGEGGKIDALSENKVGQGHTMTYTEAIETLLRNMVFVIAVPHNILRRLPFDKPKLAYEAFTEWGKYMNEMMQSKKIALTSGQDDEDDMDLMGALVKSAGYGSGNSLEKGQPPSETLSDSEIMGNAFVFILAGHETTANTIHFALAYLAMNPSTQRSLQADLDSIFQSRGPDPSKWDYDSDVPKLFGGMAGAVLNETLRLIPPAIHIPKMPTEDQTLTIDGKDYTVPAGTLMQLSALCVHRNPRYWPTGPASTEFPPVHPTSNVGTDLEEFKPERWLLSSHSNTSASGGADGDKAAKKPATNLAPGALAKTAETEALGVNTAADTAASLYKPEKGAYVPFSEGFRSCIGRRFAQVEFLAVLAVLMSRWSVELGVEGEDGREVGGEEIGRMGKAERREVWMKAREEAMGKLRRNMEVTITIKLRGATYIPLRFVRRGEEVFDF